ncbi:unnamed protein product [Prunus armeniaca]|uniref:Protein kinase domain-containing protein n=1 Tax=Prunus armeniaca TaxID=36596 RepID=A0A6J5WXX4_PRUAR|nr:unnamed protein product [Prunus armeniaca]
MRGTVGYLAPEWFSVYRLEGQADKDELTRACKVACWCIQDDEKDRPKMREVVQILQGVSDVGIPPIPQFLQRLNENPIEPPVARRHWHFNSSA